jgi:sulfur carrier protein ThiS
MKIKLSYSKFIKIEEKYPNDSVIDVPDKCTVRDLLALLKLPGYLQKSITARVNGDPVWLATVLKEDDSVTLLRSLSGG